MLLHPHVALRRLLELPDRRDLLEFVDTPPACPKCLRPMFRPHDDQDDVLADLNRSEPMNEEDFQHIEVSQRPFTDGPQRLLRHALVVLERNLAHRSALRSVPSRADRNSTRLNSQSRQYLVCRLLLEKKKKNTKKSINQHNFKFHTANWKIKTSIK